MSKTIQFLACGLAMSAIVGTASAAPVTFGTNAYEFIAVSDPYTGSNNSWTTASSAASAMSYNGISGHLATVTSADENAFLTSLVSGLYDNLEVGAWLGGSNSSGWLAGPENGSAFIFTNWVGVEPNNNSYVYMSIGTGWAYAPLGKWLDDDTANGDLPSISDASGAGYDPVVGYFVEYENGAVVPLPAALPLLASALGVFGFFGWRRKRLAAA